MPGMNPRKMQQMMRKMGIQQQEVGAVEVIIKTKDKQLVFSNPSVSKVNMMGQETFQLTGNFEELPLSSGPEINTEDIELVMGQTNATKERVSELLKQNNGDIAKTILELSDD